MQTKEENLKELEIRLDFLKRAKAVRKYLSQNPGSTYSQIIAALYPLKCPVMWLHCKGYISRTGGGKGGPVVYRAKPMESLEYDESLPTDQPMATPAKEVGNCGES